MARERAKPPSLDEMLSTLRNAYAGRLAPRLGGFVYRFTLFLPLLSEGHPVFTDDQRELLADLFHACMRGYTETASEGHPPWYGSWAPPDGKKPVIDRHTLMVVYTPQVDDAKEFFRQLRWILDCKHIANQDVVLIEHTTAWLVDTTPLADA